MRRRLLLPNLRDIVEFLFLLVLEDPCDMLGSSTVLFGDTVGVVMGHSHG